MIGINRRCRAIRERKNMLIEDDVSGQIYTAARSVQTFVAMMDRRVSEKHTLPRSKVKFVGIIWAKVGPARTSERAQKLIVGFVFSEEFHRSNIVENTTRHAVNKIGSRENGFIPETFRHRGLG
jgi:hypothetical protein